MFLLVLSMCVRERESEQRCMCLFCHREQIFSGEHTRTDVRDYATVCLFFLSGGADPDPNRCGDPPTSHLLLV